MRVITSIVATLLLAVVCTASADVILLRNGNRIEAENVRVDGERVVFIVFGGRMSIALSSVEKIEKSDRPAAANAGLRNAVSGPAFTGTAGAPGAAGAGSEGGQSDKQSNNELVQFYIGQRQQLQKEVLLYDQQIQTLQSVIYAKAAINSDTSEERARLQELEGLKKVASDKMANIMSDARKAGLSPGDIRAIESARSDALSKPVTKLEGDRDPRDAEVTWIDVNSTDDSDRESDVILTEDADPSRSSSPEDEQKKKKK